MAVNKVVYGTDVLVDLTSDTVTPDTLAEGVTAHDNSGSTIVGTMKCGGGITIKVRGALPNAQVTLSHPTAQRQTTVSDPDGNCDFAVGDEGKYTITDGTNTVEIAIGLSVHTALVLPAEYQQTAYIQNTVSCPWNFGVIGGSIATFDLKATISSPGNGGYMRYFGISDTSLTSLQAMLTQGYNGRAGFYSGNSTAITGTGVTTWEFHTFSDNTGTINGTAYKQFVSKNIGWGNTPWSICNGLSTKLYYLKMHTDGQTVRDLVPCYRKSDSVIGMYDKIEGILYPVPDVSKFVIGPDV